MVAASAGDSGPDALYHVKALLRQVVRGFYLPKHCILLDIVLKHSAIRDDYISLIMGLQNQEIRRLCGRLREDRLITMQTKIEYKEGQTRPINRSYYYVDYRDATDAIKFRLHKLVRVIEEKSRNDFDSKGYVCPYCARRYGPLDVLPLVASNGQGFNCADCGALLADDEESLESRASQERLGRLQRQTSKIISTLKEIDATFVPNNDFNSALQQAILPAELLNTPNTSKPNGITSSVAAEVTTTAALGVSIDYDAFQTESPEDKARRLEQAQRNQLPDWHMESTISGDDIKAQAAAAKEFVEEDAKSTKLDASTENEVEAYYRSLKAQALNTEAESDDDDAGQGNASDDDDDDDTFEDVGNGAGNVGATATSALPLPENGHASESDDDDFEDV